MRRAATVRCTASVIGASEPSNASAGWSASSFSTAAGESTGAANTGPTPGSI